MKDRTKRKLALIRRKKRLVTIADPIIVKVVCSRKKLQLALRRRYVLSSRFVVGITFLVLVTAASILLSRTVWAEYDPWNIPSLLSGLATTVLTFPVVVWVQKLIEYGRAKKPVRSFGSMIHVAIRRGHASLAFMGLSVILGVALLVFPARDLLKEVHAKIGFGGPNGLIAARELYEGKVAKAPRYIGDSGAACLGAVLDAFDLDRLNTPSSKWDEVVRRVKPAKNDRRDFIRDWSAYVVAMAHSNNERLNEAKAELTILANSETTDRNIRFLSHFRLAYMAQIANDLESAKGHYIDLMQIGSTSGICENLAIIFEDQGFFELAEPIFQRSQRLFEIERKSSPHPRAAVHFTNLASFYNNYANFLLGKSKDASLTDSARAELLKSRTNKILVAQRYIHTAHEADPNDLEMFWVAASIELTANNADRAIAWLDKAGEFLNRKDDAAVAARAKNQYATIGPFYNAWFRVRALYESAHDSPALPAAIRELSQQVVGFSYAPADRLRLKLIDVQASGFSDRTDLSALEEMNKAGVFSSYVTPISKSISDDSTAPPAR